MLDHVFAHLLGHGLDYFGGDEPRTDPVHRGPEPGQLQRTRAHHPDDPELRAVTFSEALEGPEVTPGVLRGLKRIAAEYATRHSKEFNAFGFWFGSEHPLFDLMPGTLTRVMRPYAFYVRVPDVPAFIRTIAPVLETRLAGSLAVGYTGTLELNFYVDGLRIEFERGRLKAVEPWKSNQPRDGNAHFSGLTFLHLLFGHHSLDDLKATREDCWADNDTTRALLNILFP